MRRVVFGLGSNLGGRFSMLRAAHDLFAYGFDGHVRDSRVRLTAPVGPPQPDFANAAILLRTDAPPEALLSIAMRIEEKLGRVRRERWGPRTIDVDVLWSEGETLSTDALSLPHPRLRERTFALEPLVELVPDAVDPRDGARYADVLASLASPAKSLVDYEIGEGFFTREVMDHTADEGFTVSAFDRADALAACAEALADVMVHRTSVKPLRVLSVEASAGSSEGFSDDCERLYAWLAEVLYTLDAKRFAARRVCVLEDGPTLVRGLILGEPLETERHDVGTAVKAITWHDMRLEATPEGPWEARVIVDV
jgi:2-amino-4-hydroxy-6-hydroxymethyldihydropteridine diphosphokinase